MLLKMSKTRRSVASLQLVFRLIAKYRPTRQTLTRESLSRLLCTPEPRQFLMRQLFAGIVLGSGC